AAAEGAGELFRSHKMSNKQFFVTDKWRWDRPVRENDVYVWHIVICDNEAADHHLLDYYVLANAIDEALAVAHDLCRPQEGDTVISIKMLFDVTVYAAPGVQLVAGHDLRAWEEAHGRPRGSS